MFKPPHYTDDYIERFRTNIKEYEVKGEKELSFKSFGATTGVYQERSGITYMVRPRTPGGFVTLEQFKTISKVANKYGKRHIRFTTRQDIQFHKVELEDTVKIMDELKKVNIFTVGTGGNASRNAACSPLSGVEKGEAFDVSLYSVEATNYMAKDENSVKFPRKFKMSFSNTREDTGNVTFSDLGFIAKMENGEEKFEVHTAGGFGAGSRVSFKLEESIDTKDMLYYVEAAKEFFFNEGDRKNRSKARFRHIVARLGEEEFKIKFNEYLKEAKKKDLSLDIDRLKEQYREEYATEYACRTDIESNIVSETKYEGLYSVYIHPRRAKINTPDLNKVLKFIGKLEYEVSIRITPTQGFVIRGLAGNHTEELLEIIKPFSSSYDIDNSLVCVGADTCRTGIGSSQTLFLNILNKFKDVEHEVKSQLPRLYVSGCPSACGQHLRGAIGFSGKLRRINGKPTSVYTIYFGGKVGDDVTLATRHSDILGRRVPNLLLELAIMKKESGYKEFEDFLNDRKETIENLVDRYKLD